MHTIDTFINGLNTQVKTRNTYSQGGWAGSNYQSGRSTGDITKIIREYVKTKYPKYRFSVTKQSVSSIRVSLMSGPVSPLATPDESKVHGKDLTRGLEDFMKRWNYTVEKQTFGVNHYYIDDSVFLTDEAKVMFKDIVKFVQSFNYDDSDAQTDYFDTNFYLNVEVGKWDRPFITTNN